MVIVQEIPYDLHLPQLAILLDVAEMLARFQSLLSHDPLLHVDSVGGQRYHLQSCEIERVKYRPGKNAIICYRLEVALAGSSSYVTQRFCARVYPVGRSGSRFRRAQEQPLVRPQFGPPLSHIPELGMILWAFPNDRKLRGLPMLMDAAYLRHQLLPPLVARYWGDAWQIASLHNELVHYAPEYTCTVRTGLRLAHLQSDQEQAVTLFGKLYEDEQGLDTARMMEALWLSEARRSGRLNIAMPLIYNVEERILWQRGLHGKSLQESYLEGQSFYRRLAQVVEAVAALHQSGIIAARSVGLSDWTAKLEQMRQLLPQVWPPCRQRANTLIDALLQQAERLDEQPLALLHGDLHLQNIFCENDKVALIDLDNLCNGSPWQDIGSFIAALHYRALVGATPTTAVDDAAAHFYHHYLQHTHWPPTPASLAWYTAAALVTERAFRTVTRLQSGGLTIIDAILERASTILE